MLMSGVESQDEDSIYALAQGVKRNRGGENRNQANLNQNGEEEDSDDTKYIRKILKKFKNSK